MRCGKTKLASPYIDGELEGEEKTLFEAHLRGCLECSRRIEGIRTTRALFANAERCKAPCGFSARVMAKAAERETKRFPLFPLWAKFAEVTVVLVMITVGILSGRFLTNSIMGQRTVNIASSFSLEIFEPAPPGSLGGAYLALMEAGNEK
jgi:hypothetical protein